MRVWTALLGFSVVVLASGCSRQVLNVPEGYVADATTPVQTVRVLDKGPGYYGSLSDAYLRSLLTLREFQIDYRFDGEWALRMNEKGLSVRAGLPPVRLEGVSYPGALSEAYSRVMKDPGFVVPLLKHDDTAVVMTGLFLVDGRTSMESQSRDQLRAAVRELSGHRNVQVRCMAFQVLSKDSDFNLQDMLTALSDRSAVVRGLGSAMTYVGENGIEQAKAQGDHATADAIARRLVPALIQEMQSASPEQRRRAGIHMRAIARHYTQDGKAFRPQAEPFRFEDAWTHSDWATRQAAIEEWRHFWEDHFEDAVAASE